MSRWLGKDIAKRSPEMVKHYLETQGALIKAFYERYGKEALQTLSEVMSEAGVESGKIALKELRIKGMNVVSELAHAKGLEIIALSDDMIHFKNLQCPYGLKGTTRELCEAIMAYDRKMVSTIFKQEAEMKIPKTIAAGDQYCEVIYTKK